MTPTISDLDMHTSGLAESPAIVTPWQAMTANEVKVLRLLADYTQAEMADMLGMSKRTYIRAEQGEREFAKGEQLLLMLWWRSLRASGLRVLVLDDPFRSQWWIHAEMGGRKWQALGPYESRRDADQIVRWLEREGL